MKRFYLIIICFVVVSALEYDLPQEASSDNSEEIHRLIGKFTSMPKERNEAVNRIAAYGDEAVPILIDSLSTTSRYAELAINTVLALERIGSPPAIESLGKLVLEHSYIGGTSKDLAVELATKSLEKLGPAGEKALVRALANKDNHIQSWVSEALARIGDPTAVSALIAALPNKHAATALGKLKDPIAVEALVAALPLHEAIVALGEIGDIRAIVPLLRTLYKGKDHSAEDALEEMKFPPIPLLYSVAAGVPENIDLAAQQAEFTDRVVNLLVSKKLNERLLAEVAIARIGHFMIPSLVKALGSSNDAHLRWATARLLGKMQEPNVENILVKALQDQNPLVVARAAYSLGELRSQPAFEPLAKLAKKGSPFERRGAVWAIARIGNPAGNIVLKELCNDKDEYVRKTAVSALKGCGT